jgi:hypothetical protein
MLSPPSPRPVTNLSGQTLDAAAMTNDTAVFRLHHRQAPRTKSRCEGAVMLADCTAARLSEAIRRLVELGLTVRK